MKLGKVLGGLALAAWPVGAWAQNADLDALLAQVPAPPVKIGAADLRWKPGDDVNGSQAHFDKDATALLAKLDQLEKAEQTGQFSYGGDSAEEMQKKMASMSQQEKMAYAMQLAKKAQADQRAAYQGSNARVLAQAQQNDVDLVHKGLASEKAAKEMSDLDAQYNAKFDALLTRMLDDVKQCPTVTQGEASGPQKACVQGILDRYGKDYRALAEAKMAAYHAIYLEFKKGATAE
ncbi:MAG TPA: hypothetical protein VFR02_01690, partial [bacterium]|nr:hypothetical protein [bacterium]